MAFRVDEHGARGFISVAPIVPPPEPDSLAFAVLLFTTAAGARHGAGAARATTAATGDHQRREHRRQGERQ